MNGYQEIELSGKPTAAVVIGNFAYALAVDAAGHTGYQITRLSTGKRLPVLFDTWRQAETAIAELQRIDEATA